MKRLKIRSSKLRDANMWMLTRAVDNYDDEVLADSRLRNAGVIEDNGHCFRRVHLPQAVAVLRFNGFEVEVEE